MSWRFRVKPGREELRGATILRVMEAGIHFGMVGGTRNSHLSLLAVVRNTSFGRGE